MHVSSLVATSFLAGAASAHGGVAGAPRLFGRNAIADLKARNVFDAPVMARAPVEAAAMPQRPAGEKRQVGGVDGQCGAGIGSCAKGYCCSLAGWCGTGKDYCAAPDCQFQFGSGCDANTIPPGTNTSSVARTTLGSVPVGNGGIYDCTVPGTVALTYDDGPYIYTNEVLDILKKYNASATFFITGNNIGKGEIDNAAYGWDTVIKRMNTEGHQIASHTWSHQNLSQITSAQRKDQMYKNEMALRNILGFFPTYMRPPYSACDQASGCWRDMKTLGYHVTYFDLDTDDYNNVTPDLIQNAKDNFDKGLAGGSPSTSEYLAIAHDIHEQTVRNLTEYMLIQLTNQGYRAVSVGECLGDPKANWYRSSSGSVFTSATGPVTAAPTTTLPVNSKTTTTSPVVTPTGISQDATCGGTTGNTCLGSTFGNCCSVNGWCGSTSDYCADGCQVQFGNCTGNTGLVSNVSVSAISTPLSTPSGSGSASAPTGTRQVSPDSSCGGTKGYTCLNSGFGNCCSQYGYCGSTSDYCGSTCQSAFGTCGSSSQ
ncbi:chitin binding protein [Phyllosticta citribraziliensis]|uniref:Chitin binding protein n=1 Tax=Phyllosticta citribraziliensis TaxID=989973 RepID=A0ABR1LLB8_9PEZI